MWEVWKVRFLALGGARNQDDWGRRASGRRYNAAALQRGRRYNAAARAQAAYHRVTACTIGDAAARVAPPYQRVTVGDAAGRVVGSRDPRDRVSVSPTAERAKINAVGRNRVKADAAARVAPPYHRMTVWTMAGRVVGSRDPRDRVSVSPTAERAKINAVGRNRVTADAAARAQAAYQTYQTFQTYQTYQTFQTFQTF